MLVADRGIQHAEGVGGEARSGGEEGGALFEAGVLVASQPQRGAVGVLLCEGDEAANEFPLLDEGRGIRQFRFGDAQLLIDFSSNAQIGQELINLAHFDRGVFIQEAVDRLSGYSLECLALEECM